MSDEEAPDVSIPTEITSLGLCKVSNITLNATYSKIDASAAETNDKVDEVKEDVIVIKSSIGDLDSGHTLHDKINNMQTDIGNLKETNDKVDEVKEDVIVIKSSIGDLDSGHTLHDKINNMQTDIGNLKETNAKVGRVEQIVGRVKDEVDNIKISISE
eukprot:835697_1